MSIRTAVLSREPNCKTPLNLEVVKALAIIEALAETGGNQTKAAKLLGIDRSTLHRTIAACTLFNIDVEVAIIRSGARPAGGAFASKARGTEKEHALLCLCPSCR